MDENKKMDNNPLQKTKDKVLSKTIQSVVCVTPKYFTVNDTLSILKVSRRTLQRWRDNGLIQFRKIRGKIFFTEADIDELMERNLVVPFSIKDNYFSTKKNRTL